MVMNFFTRELQGSIENVRALFLSLFELERLDEGGKPEEKPNYIP
jgi:hypothetical protein